MFEHRPGHFTIGPLQIMPTYGWGVSWIRDRDMHLRVPLTNYGVFVGFKGDTQ